MGMNSKKEKPPEKKLVEDIWEEIKLILSDRSVKLELIGIVEKAYNSGAICEEIQRLYEENLPRYQRKKDIDIAKVVDALSKPLPVREKIIGIGFLALIAVAIVACILFNPASSEIRYGDVTVDGLSFHVPERFDLAESGEFASSIYYKYEDSYRIGNYKNRRYVTDYLDIYVFEGRTADQALDSFKFGDDKEPQRDITYGNYTGIRVDTIVLPFKNKAPQWFIFEKDGNAVAVYFDNQALFDKAIPNIIE